LSRQPDHKEVTITTLSRRIWKFALLFVLALLAGAVFLFIWGSGSPASRARAHTLAATQELSPLPPFTILDQEAEESVALNGCSVNKITLRIGSPVSLSESVALFRDAAQKIGWTRQSDNYAGILYYFDRGPGEVLALYRENIGPREWLQPPDTGNYASFLYVVVASGNRYLTTCDSF
jgi:hypothetical protein